MKILIGYDSVFGNTKQIAQAICDSLSSKGNVEILRVTDIKPEQLTGVELLIIGSPTRAFRPTKEMTNFLGRIPSMTLKGVKVATFDTRVSVNDTKSRVLSVMVKFFGYAAKPMADSLVKKGGSLVLSPEGFFVKDSEGPLKEGELERAVEWGKDTLK